ncbi:ribosome small subunit-dependent GTPase A [Corynebacterium sp. TAE3-ERU12]|uniref:ribosome small subunit-dependent GTPase A n=1 Tax=Corynebacterium sp. TAE3-ERU12 TaxID=2849491 RepID=UPI001C453739|nr:ribosome small subunit-dependent GTPase A [Corynebacterium sp. TAE3-ERU12]MBV7294828.1 ribosome small subunit-dependent GTPase A [Corynebacterium sp. TAE3-ERU12]
MSRRRSEWDESDAKFRRRRGSRPRTKDRPSHDDAVSGMVITKDRGRWGVHLDDGTVVTCMRARELGRVAIVVGDRVGVVGDTSGKEGTLARIVRLDKRCSVLRRTADDTDPYERIVVANAEKLLIVCAVADPPPRTGFVERALIAAYAGGVDPVLCLTKSDLADPSEFAAEFTDLDVPVIVCGVDDPLDPVLDVTRGTITALIGHSGVGKSTLVNRLVPDADRATGVVSGVGKGRHTSTQTVALAHNDGWIIDTPGIRSFGLAHITPETVLSAFPDLEEHLTACPRGCTHLGPPADPECALDTLDGTPGRRALAVRELISAVSTKDGWELDIDRD